jgi:hypothetical protein
MMQAAMMLSAQSFAVRDNRRTFLPEFSVAELNSNPVGAITRLAHALPALALGGVCRRCGLRGGITVRLVPAPPTDVPQTR